MRTVITLLTTIFFIINAIAQAPVNDLCANAILLPISTDCLFNPEYSNVGATGVDPDVTFDPICLSMSAEHDVWFYFVVPPSGNAHIDFWQRGFPISAEVYSGDCNNLEIVLDDNGNCVFHTNEDYYYSDVFIDLERTPGEIVYIRLFGGEGNFLICGAEYEQQNSPSTCQNPTPLTVSTNCDLVFSSTLSQGLHWFSLDMPAHVPYVNIGAFGVSYGGAYSNIISVYDNNCDNLELIAESSPGSTVILENNGDPNQSFLISVKEKYALQPGVFGICAQYKENDFCSGATLIDVGTTCNKVPISSFGSSSSKNPTQSSNCGFLSPTEFEDHDAWAYAVVPPSGNLTFQLFVEGAPPLVTFERAIEFYSGDCESLNILNCSRISFADDSPIKTIPFTGLTPGSLIYSRVFFGMLPEGFAICAFEGNTYGDFCRVDAVVFDEIGQCDPNTNLFIQPFTVHYTAPPGTNNNLRMDGRSFQLSGNSPDNFSIALNPGEDYFFHQNTKITGDCSSPSEFNYLHLAPFFVPETCPLAQTNDFCEYAIEIDPILECTVGTEFFPDNNPTKSSYIPKLSDHRDIWYKFEVTSQTQYIDLFYEYSVNSSARPFLEIFKGDCNNLELIPNPSRLIGNEREPIELSHLNIGETIFIRVVFDQVSTSRSFSFCAIPLCEHENYVADPILNMDSVYQANYLVYSSSTINNNVDITFKSNNIIELLEGFEVKKQNVFNAIIEHCD